MLFRQKSQPDVPVPRNDLTKLILASYGNVKKANVSNAIIALAQESFAKAMGLDMRELKVMPVSKGKPKIGGLASWTLCFCPCTCQYPSSATALQKCSRS